MRFEPERAGVFVGAGARYQAQMRPPSVLLFAFACSPKADPAAAAPASDPPAWAITGVWVTPITGPSIAEGTVVVVGDRIAAVGPSAAIGIPPGAQVVDGAGATVLPGWSDLHAHLPADDVEREQFLRAELRAGVTTVRSMRGEARDPALRDRIERGELVGPHLVLGSVPIAADAPLGPDEAEARVAAAVAAGFDAIKLLGVPDRASYVNLAEAAARHGLPVVGHLPGSVSAADAFAYHQASIEHLNGVLAPWRTSPDAGRAAAAALADPAILHVPTVTWAAIRVGAYSEESLRALDVDHTISEARWAAWRTELPPASPAHGTADAAIADRLGAIRALYEAGARLGIGPDASDAYGLPGVSVAEEMRWFGVARLPNDAVLRAATQRPDGPATIAVGAPADLVVVRGDPSVDLGAAADVIGVVLSGTWWTREALAAPEPSTADDEAG